MSGKRSVNVLPTPTWLVDRDRASDLLDNLPRDRQPQPESAPLGRDEVVEDCVERSGGMPVPVSAISMIACRRSAQRTTMTRPRGGVAWNALVIRLR